MKIYVAVVEAPKKKEGLKLNLPLKLVEKLIWVPIISFCKISFLLTHSMPYYAKIGHFCPLIT
jgi:hypothetical protein